MFLRHPIIGIAASVALGACASVATQSAPVAVQPAYPHLERVCVSADGKSGRITALSGYAVDMPGGRPVATTAARECFFPWVESAGWSRIETAVGPAGAGRNFVFGMAETPDTLPADAAASTPIGAASFDLDPTGAITHATIGGPVGLSWRWDDAGRTLARLDLIWADQRLTVGGRLGGTTRVHIARAAARPERRASAPLRVWESTVFGDPDPSHRLHEAWVADGPLPLDTPRALPMSGIHPICPLAAREQWEDFDGVTPRVQHCLRAGVEWLRVERDLRGRITAVTERLATTDRTVRLEWRDEGAVPTRVWVESGSLPDGLEVHLDRHGVPELTRHYRLGQREGLEVEWSQGRADTARLWVDGSAGPEREIVTRGDVIGGKVAKDLRATLRLPGSTRVTPDQPTLTIDIPALPSTAPLGAWLDLE